MNKEFYLPVYKKIEKEVLQLSSAISFDDDQIGVYSLDIAGIIIRCAVEIESLVKEIYRKETGGEPTGTGKCVKWLEDNWKIAEKKVYIITPYFHFKENIELQPFNYTNGSPEDYYAAYNAIKHDRLKNIKKASVYVMIHALAALYILNVYYEDKKIYLGDDSHATKMLDKTSGSEIFAFEVAPCDDEIRLTSEEEIVPQNCIYKIIRKIPHYAFGVNYINEFGEHKKFRASIENRNFQVALKSRIGQLIDEEKMWEELSSYTTFSSSECKNQFYIHNKVKIITSILIEQNKAAFWAELNKE